MESDEIRERLGAELASLDEELADLTNVTRDPAATIGFGKRVGEGTTEAIGRLERVGQAEALAAKRAEIVRALEKLEEGTSGRCDVCGLLIPVERLEARPWSTRCVAHAAG
jgi:DnaK suppressor protein